MSQPDNQQNTPPMAPAAPPRASRWVKIVLILSVSLNLLVLGAIGSHFYKLKRGDGFMPGGYWAQGQNMFRAMPHKRRQMIFDTIQPQREELRQARRAVGEARRRAGEALRSGNRENYQRAFRELADAESRALQQYRSIMVDVAGRLTDKERKNMARHMQRRRMMMR